MQDYLRDACRIFPVKVFVVEFFKETTDDRPYKQVYFTSRFEMGHCSVYEKLAATHGVLTASNIDQYRDASTKLESIVTGAQSSSASFGSTATGGSALGGGQGLHFAEAGANYFNDDKDIGFHIGL